MKEDQFFATVILLAYNSAEYISETLESIRNQAFRDFEVIVADDGSTDSTREMCAQFFEKYAAEFKKVTILPEEPNMGTSANCNRGVRTAKGRWIKLIAGDDLLHPECLQRLFVADQSSDAQLYCGEFITFHIENGQKVETGVYPSAAQKSFFTKSAADQHRILLKDSFNMAPAVCIRRSLFDEVGYFDERFRLLEDLPYWIKLTGHGIRFRLIPHPVVYYRTNHESAVFAGEKFYNQRFMDGLFDFRRQVVYKEVPKTDIVFYQAEMMERLNYFVITRIFGNKKTPATKLVSKMILFPTLRRVTKLFRL